MDDTKMSDLFIYWSLLGPPSLVGPPVISLSHSFCGHHESRYTTVYNSQTTYIHAHKTRRSNPQHDWPCQKRFTTKEYDDIHTKHKKTCKTSRNENGRTSLVNTTSMVMMVIVQ